MVIAWKEDISMEQVRALEQHGKLIRRVKPEQRRCLEKGWWKTGERRRIKGRHEHLVWEKESNVGFGLWTLPGECVFYYCVPQSTRVLKVFLRIARKSILFEHRDKT